MIIGVCGFIGSGKDTVADYLVNIHGFKRESFASSLKDAVAAIFGWDRDMLEGRTKEARICREQIDAWWAKRLDIPNLTPRMVLQQMGTEVFRNHFHDDIWIASLEAKLAKTKENVVITDCRFPNEIKAIRNHGGLVARVYRGENPDFYDDALASNSEIYSLGFSNDAIQSAKTNLKNAGVHPSETSWVGSSFDVELSNSSSFDDLYSQIENFVGGKYE